MTDQPAIPSSMAVEINCILCGHSLVARAHFAGQSVRCGACGGSFAVSQSMLAAGTPLPGVFTPPQSEPVTISAPQEPVALSRPWFSPAARQFAAIGLTLAFIFSLGGVGVMWYRSRPAESARPNPASAHPGIPTTLQISTHNTRAQTLIAPVQTQPATTAPAAITVIGEISGWKLIRRFEGHPSPVNALAVSSDGKYILSAGGVLRDDNTLRLWDAATGRQLRDFKGHTGAVTAAAFSRDGARVVSGSADQSVRLWDTASAIEIKAFAGHQILKDRTFAVTSVAISTDGRTVVSGGDDGMRLWDVASGNLIRHFPHKSAVHSVAFAPDSRHVLSACGESEPVETLQPAGDNLIRVFSLADGKAVREFKGHQFAVYTIAFSPDGKRLASASADRTARLWDYASGQEVFCFKGHSGEVRTLAFCAGGERLVTGGGTAYAVTRQPRLTFTPSPDVSVCLWDLQTGQLISTCEPSHPGPQAVAATPSGGILFWARSAIVEAIPPK